MTKTIIRNEQIFRCPGSATSAMEPSKVVASNRDPGVERRVPLFIPADQAYFWSSQWQRDEAESLVDLRAGRARTFDDPQDAIRHLLSDE
jgi:hypothetical protein